MTQNYAFQKIPVVDISSLVRVDINEEEKTKAALEINNACRNVGFFYVKNHGIATAHIETVFSEIKRFFDLPIEEKMKIHIGKSNIFRGYTPIGKELTNDKRDWHESVDFGLDLSIDHPEVLAGKPLQGPNPWPENLPDFRKILTKHWDLMLNLGSRITEGLALSLKLEQNYFQQFTSKSQSSMRILHYPPYQIHEPAKNIGDGIGAHIDYGFLTILAQDAIGGLEVRNAANEWIPAPHIPGTFIINMGHMTQRWTNDFYKATLHRVRSKRNKSRYSFPFFFEPNFDTVVAPLESLCSPENPPGYEPFHFGTYLIEKFTRSYAENIIED